MKDRRMAATILAAVLALPWPGAARAADSPQPSPPAAAGVDVDTLEMVKAFLKIPTSELPVDLIPRFLAVDPAALPKPLRRPTAAKRLELYTLKQLGQTRKQGNIIIPDAQCEAPKDAKSQDVALLMKAGYQEITEEEEAWLTGRTRCTEHDMLCEFSLQILDEEFGAGRKVRRRRRYFLFCRNSCDPLMVLVGVHRAHVNDPNTNFFGTGAGPVCSR
jgi:hypothetical protein